MQKSVWLFSEGSAKDNTLLGNKGANLCEMTALKDIHRHITSCDASNLEADNALKKPD